MMLLLHFLIYTMSICLMSSMLTSFDINGTLGSITLGGATVIGTLGDGTVIGTLGGATAGTSLGSNFALGLVGLRLYVVKQCR